MVNRTRREARADWRYVRRNFRPTAADIYGGLLMVVALALIFFIAHG